jgi:hypothetical protein
MMHLVSFEVMDSCDTDFTCTLSWTNCIHSQAKGLQCLEGNHSLHSKKIPIDRHSAHLANPTTLPTENPKTLVSSINNTTALSSQVWMEETMIGTPGRRRRRRKVLE